MSWLEAVVMICGPHHPEADALRGGYVCPSAHDPAEPTRCFSRIDHAVRVAHEHRAPLIVCGDANEGRDVRAFCERARQAGIKIVCQAVRVEGASNTFHDLRMAVGVMVKDPDFNAVTAYRLVTDPWHLPRAEAMAKTVIAEVCAEAGRPPFELRTSAVNPCWRAPDDMLEREVRGLKAFLDGTYQGGHPAGKPELQSSRGAT